MLIDYDGDDGPRIISWFKQTMRGIAFCLDNRLPEAAVCLIYSAIDTFGFLAASPGVEVANRKTFMTWCEKYLLAHVSTVDGQPLTALDLYAARCGVLHTSTPQSALGQNGRAREVWYEFEGQTGLRLMGVYTTLPAIISIVSLAVGLKKGGSAFCRELLADPVRAKLADDRSQHFMRWAKVEIPTPASGG